MKYSEIGTITSDPEVTDISPFGISDTDILGKIQS